MCPIINILSLFFQFSSWKFVTLVTSLFVLITTYFQCPLATTDLSLSATMTAIENDFLHGDKYEVLKFVKEYPSWLTHICAIFYNSFLTIIIMRDVLIELHTIFLMIILYLIAQDFKTAVLKGVANKSNSLVATFKAIYRLARLHTKCHGSLLLIYLIDMLWYTSITAIDSSSFYYSFSNNVVVLGTFICSFFLAAFAADGVSLFFKCFIHKLF